MIALTIAEIAQAMNGQIVLGDPNLVVSQSADTDSRSLEKGGIFFAKLGEYEDGHRYLEQVAGIAALAVVSVSAQAPLDVRVALIIGNSAYPGNMALVNPA